MNSVQSDSLKLNKLFATTKSFMLKNVHIMIKCVMLINLLMNQILSQILNQILIKYKMTQ